MPPRILLTVPALFPAARNLSDTDEAKKQMADESLNLEKLMNMTKKVLSVGVVIFVLTLMLSIGMAKAEDLSVSPLPLPDGTGGIGFDDLGFAPSIHRILAPAGRTGNVDLIDPDTRQITTIGGFSTESSFGGGHGESVTSADVGRGLLFATDRSAKRLDVIDLKAAKIVESAPLVAGPDYVRYVPDTGELWVTEPRAGQIEVFSLPPGDAPKPSHSGIISVSGGPESLVIDSARGRAYSNLFSDVTLAIDLKTRREVARWKNGCAGRLKNLWHGSRGLALDEQRGFLFVGCDEGKVSVLDLKTGKQISEASSGSGVDIIAYDDKLAHLYLPGEESATMAIIGISSHGAATVLGTVKTADGSHCVVADDRGNAYVCDPSAGRLLVFKDTFPGSE